MTVMLIKLKVLNVEFKALHVVTPVHHSELISRKKKKRLNLPTLHFSSYWIVHIFSYITPPNLYL